MREFIRPEHVEAEELVVEFGGGEGEEEGVCGGDPGGWEGVCVEEGVGVGGGGRGVGGAETEKEDFHFAFGKDAV